MIVGMRQSFLPRWNVITEKMSVKPLKKCFRGLAPKVSYPWFGYGVKDGGVVFS